MVRRILINCANDHHRSRLRGPDESSLDDTSEATVFRRILDEDPLPYSDSLHLDFLHSFDDEDVWYVLDRLDPKFRIPLVLVHMEGFSTATRPTTLDHSAIGARPRPVPVAGSSVRAGPCTWRQPYLSDGAVTD